MKSGSRDEQRLGASVSLSGLTKTYTGRGRGEEVEALRAIDLEVPSGEFVSVVGPSGCGKSTLLRIIAGLDFPTLGRIEVDGRRVAGPSPDRGLMFQQYALFPWKTIWDNVAFGPRARGWGKAKRIEVTRRYIDLVGLSGFEKKYPFELSGGMQQRAAFARILANEPTLLLMDEPLAAVDAQTRMILQDEVLRVWGESLARSERRTVLYVTHDIEEAVYLADRVVVLHRRPGSIAAEITIEAPRPRGDLRGARELEVYRDEIWTLIRDEAYEATREG